MSQVTFRVANTNDIDLIARLYFEFFAELRGNQGWRPHDYVEYVAEIRNYFERGDIFVVAETSDGPIGFSRISERDGSYWIEEIYIKPEYRGRGYGRKLVEFVENIIKKHDIAAYIMVLPQDRKALSFWIKMGYTLLNTIELAKDFEPTTRSEKTRTMEILGIPLKISKWEKEMYNSLEVEYLETLERFYRLGGDQKTFLSIVKKALEEWIRGKK